MGVCAFGGDECLSLPQSGTSYSSVFVLLSIAGAPVVGICTL
jgi:hypothetical protein